MRRRRSGAIVNIASVAAAVPFPGSGYYAATKSALESVSDAMRKELAPLNIRVMVVEPGAFRTDFSGRSLTQSATVINDYCKNRHPSPICTRFEHHFHALKPHLHRRSFSDTLPENQRHLIALNDPPCGTCKSSAS